MQLRPSIQIWAEITINDKEAEILEHLCSYDLSEWFAEKCSHKYDCAYLQKTLGSVRNQARLIVAARNKAMNAVQSKQSGE